MEVEATSVEPHVVIELSWVYYQTTWSELPKKCVSPLSQQHSRGGSLLHLPASLQHWASQQDSCTSG